jgi:hypothetical protein
MLVAGLLITALLHPVPAQAGDYEQFDCRRPDGTFAPSDSWVPIVRGAGSVNLCLQGPSRMTVNLSTDSTPPDSYASLAWSENRPNLYLRGFVIRRSVSMGARGGPGLVVYRLNAPTEAFTATDIRDTCHADIGCFALPEQILSVQNLSGGTISLILECRYATCDDGSTIHGGHHSVMVDAVSMTLRDDGIPRVDGVAGALASQRPLWGLVDLRYRAADDESGVYRQRLVVDGRTVVEEVPDANGGRCRDSLPGSGTAYQFDYTIPCPANVAGRILFDIGELAPGPHEIEASVEDASGNRRTIYAGRIETVSDPARRVFDLEGVAGLTNPFGDQPGLVPNGAGASRAATLTAAFVRPRGKRTTVVTRTFPGTPTVVGHLSAAGQPVVGATVSLLESSGPGGSWASVAGAQTASDGSVRFHLPSGPSRALRLAYFADSEAESFVSSPVIRLRVRPRVSLRASPSARRTGQRVRFTGSVKGGTLPPNGLIVRLEAGAARSRWITFRSVRTGSRGRFRATYRFTNTRGSVRYRFRASVQLQADYPFERGTSRSAWVRVRG